VRTHSGHGLGERMLYLDRSSPALPVARGLAATGGTTSRLEAKETRPLAARLERVGLAGPTLR